MQSSLPEQTVHLSDVQRVLTLFTQGIAGRYLQLQAVEPDTVAGKVMAKPVLSDASHEVIALSVPKSMSGFDNYRDNLAAYRIAVLHQIGFLENGTYSFTLAGARRRMRGLPSDPKYDALGEGAPDMLRFFMLWPLPELMRTVFMTVEDLRIDTAVRRRYPGARKDLERVLARALSGREPPEDPSLAAALLEALVRFSLGASADALLTGDKSGLLKPMLEAAVAVKEEKAGVYDSVRAAAVCFRMLLRASQANPTVPLPGEEGEIVLNEEPGEASPSTITPQLKALRSKEVDFRGELNPELMYSESMSGFEDMLDEEVRDGTDGAFGPPSKDAAQEIYEREREDAQPLLGGEYSQAEERPVEVRLFLYDEWNYLENRMLKGWCRLFERRLQGDDMAFIREVRRRHAALSYQVRRRFQFIRPEAYQRVHRVSDGEEIELDGLIEAVIDRRAGFATDERLYMRRDRALRDVAAAFLLDVSGSTGIAVPTGFFGKPGDKEEEQDPVLQWARRGLGKSTKPQARRSVIDVAKESLALMGDALQTLGDSYAIYGFSGDGRMQVDFLVAKDFEDRLSLRTWAALAAMRPQRSTRMGPAIRHAVAKLRPQPTHMKVLIIVSDGYPQDKDYGPDGDTEYGIQDTAAALREAAAEGVQTFCITIDPAGYDYLRRMCEKDRYLVIDDVADLPDQLQKVYRALTV